MHSSQRDGCTDIRTGPSRHTFRAVRIEFRTIVLGDSPIQQMGDPPRVSAR